MTARSRSPAKAGVSSSAADAQHPHRLWQTDTGLAFLLALLALLLRVVYLLETADNPFRMHLDLDPGIYDRWARAIFAGQLFGPGPFPQAPLYPYFLAACYALLGADPLRTLWIHAVLAGSTTYLGARTAGRYGGRTALIAAGLALALYKPGIFYTGVLLMPVLTTLLLAAALWFAPRHPFWAGLCAGAAGLAHPVILPGAAVAVLGLTLRSARGGGRDGAGASRRRVVLALVGTLVALLPTTIHNFVHSGHLVPISTNAGINLHIGNGLQATGFYAAPQGVSGDEDPLGIGQAQHLSGRPLTPVEASRFWSDQTWQTVRSQPGRALMLALRKAYFFLCAYEAPQIESLDFEKRYSTILRLPFLPNWIVLAILAAMALVLCRRRRWLWTLSAAIALTALMTAIFFVTGRFRFPAHLFLALLAAAAVAELVAHLRKDRRLPSRRIVGALTVGGLVALALWPNWLGIDRTRTFGQYHFRLGVFAERDDRLLDAMREYTDALETDPTIARAAINLGILTARGGDLDRANALLRWGVRDDPRSARGLLALGQIQQLRGHPATAGSLYARAWAADTTFLKGLEFLATTTYLLGDTVRAEELAAELLDRAPPHDPIGTRCQFLLDRIAERRRHGWAIWLSQERAEADLAVAVRNWSSALELYRRALARDPNDLATLLELARIAIRGGDAAEAARLTARFRAAGGPPAALAPLR